MADPYCARGVENVTRSFKRDAGRGEPVPRESRKTAWQSGSQTWINVWVVENAKKRADDDKDDQHEEDRVEHR
jgi:hypothetical protein